MDDRQIREKLGALLKAERERQQISLADLGEQLKISEPHLECIEQGDATGLPSELYFSLFAKSYAQSLGIDYNRTLEAIKAELLEQASPVKKPSRNAAKAGDGEETEEEESSQFKTIGWIAGIAVGAVAIFFLLNTFVFTDDSGTSATGGDDGPSPAAVIDDAAFASYNWQAPADAEPPEPLTLTMTARSDVWTTVFADGDTAFRSTLRPGNPRTITANHRLQLWIAAPSRVQLTLDGQSIDARDPATNRVSGVEINQLNKDRFLSGDNAAAPDRTTSATAPNPPSPAPPQETEAADNEPAETETDTDNTEQANSDSGE